jgi:hypothetical protein
MGALSGGPLFGDPEGGLKGRTSLLSIRGSIHREIWGLAAKGESGNGASLSMGALLGNLERGVPLLETMKFMKRRLWVWASLLMGAQLGNLDWAHLPGTLRYGWKGLWCNVVRRPMPGSKF